MTFSEKPGGVCAASGFLAAGISAGIKKTGKPDLALLLSETTASAAGVFSRNSAAAAPVRLCRQRVPTTEARGVVVNSGCANACTGERGSHDALTMASLAAEAAGVASEQMLVCSTGLIGSYLPMEKIRDGINSAAHALSRDDAAAAQAILTTDTTAKRAAFINKQQGWSIGGMAKGAGMIAPDMATMLAFITTDARVMPEDLHTVLKGAVQDSFNSITVDGDSSTNDTVLAFANGASEVEPSPEDLAEAMSLVCNALARMIVADGEGATKVVEISISGAEDPAQARLAARTVAESILVKTALHGEDANWGRVAAALGRSGAHFEPARLSISIAGVPVLDHGAAAGSEFLDKARSAMASREFSIECNLGPGKGSARIWTTDLSPEYVRLNAAYE